MADIDLSDVFSAKFRSGGRGGGALDCQGVMIDVMRRFGIGVTETDVADYAVETVAAAIDGEVRSGRWRQIDEPETGCVVVMAMDPRDPDKAQHVGVYIGDGRFVHILEKTGALTTRIDDRFFKGKIRGYYRWIG